MDDKAVFIDYIKKYRHEWLNYVQIIKGYLELGKIDEVHKYFDFLVVKASEESDICKLGDSELAYYLLTYQWRVEAMVLETEIEGEDHLLKNAGSDYPFLLAWVQNITSLFERHCHPSTENHFSLGLSFHTHKLLLSVEFSGSCSEHMHAHVLQKVRQLIVTHGGILKEEDYDQSTLRFKLSVRLPQ